MIDRFKSALEGKLKSRLPQNIKDAINETLKYLKNKKLVVETPHLLTTEFHYPEVVSFDFFRCPNCGRMYDRSTISTLECSKCKRSLVQAYVGAPTESALKIGIFKVKSIPTSRLQDYIVLPADRVLNIECPKSRSLKGIKARNPQRPLYSLGFACPHDDSSCGYYNGGFCKHGGGRVYFPKQGGMQRALAPPSEGLTKPYVEVVFREVEESEDLTDIFNESFSNAFAKVSIGEFNVYSLCLFYLIGHNYASRRSRLPAIVVDKDGNMRVIGRFMKTSGLLFRLDPRRVDRVKEELKDYVSLNNFTITHSVAHAALKSLVRLTGLSYKEFGEAIYIDGEQLEVLIYDDSPGGIGGVTSVKAFLKDFEHYLRESAAPCPRACRSACRACLYLENCGSLNFELNWMAVNYYLLEGGRP